MFDEAGALDLAGVDEVDGEVGEVDAVDDCLGADVDVHVDVEWDLLLPLLGQTAYCCSAEDDRPSF